MKKFSRRLLVWMSGLALALSASAAPDLAEAQTLLSARKFAEAAEQLQKLARAEPKNAEVHFYLGQALAGRNDLDAGIKSLEQAATLAPQTARYHHRLGDLYGQAAQKAGVLSKLGLAKKCAAAFQKAAELEPTNLLYQQSLFEYYRRAPSLAGGGADKALATAAVITKLDPVRGHLAYVNFHVGEKQFDQALPHAAELKKLDPARGRIALANIYTESKQYAKAFAEFDDVLKSAPEDYVALYQIGRLAAVSGQETERGLVALRRCLELTPPKESPGHAAVHWRLGQLLEAKRDVAGARGAYEAALKLDPKFGAAAESLKKLK